MEPSWLTGGGDSAERLKSLVFSLAQVIWTTNADGEIHNHSASWEDFTGQTFSEFRGHGWLNAVHPDDRAGAHAVWQQAVVTQQPYQTEYRLLHKSGVYRWTIARGCQVQTNGGQTREWVGTNIDVTDQKLAEALLQGQRHILELIATGQPLEPTLRSICQLLEDQEPDLVTLIFLLSDDGLHTGMGVSPQLPVEFLQRNRGILISPPYAGSCCQALDRGDAVLVTDLTTASEWSTDWRNLNLEHGLRSVCSTPIRGTDGEILASLAIFRRTTGTPGPRNTNLLGVATHLAGIAIHSHRSARELVTREKRYRTLFESIDEGFCVLERVSLAPCDDASAPECDFRVVAANPSFATHFGGEQRVGRSIRELFPPEADEWIQICESILQTGNPRQLEKHLADQGRTLLMYAFPVDDEELPQVGIIFTDVTDFRRAQERELELATAAASANAKFRAFFEQGALFAAIISVDGVVLEPNRLSLDACGYQRAEVVGRLFWDCPWWNQSEQIIQQVREATHQAARGDTVRCEIRFFRADGSTRVADLIILPIKDEQGNVLFLAPTGTDITDRKQTEHQLAEAHQFLHSSIDALSSHIAVLNEHGCILAVNDAWRRFADENQYSGHEYGIGANYIDVCEPTSGDCIEAHVVSQGLRDVLNGQLPFFEMEYPCHSPTEHRWFVMRVTRFKSPGPVRVVVSHENVTVRKEAEEALKEANRRKDEFLATLAHELRNPLAPIRNGLQILRLMPDNREASLQAQEMMVRQVNQLVHLVDDLLDVSRISRGKIDLRRERADLRSIVQQAMETSRPLIDAQQHTLHMNLPTTAVPIFADVTRVAQVVANLLNNAAKYTDQGGQIWLTVERVASGPSGGDVAVISIRDNGVGIPTEMLPQVFEMFTQVDRTLERSQGGLGIGLSLVKKLVEMHGGVVYATSAGHARGSEFVVRLPIDASVSSHAAPSAPPLRSIASSLRVLVVDDNRDAAESLAMMLTTMGHVAQAVYDGFAALQIGESFQPDLVILDIGMPVLNGYETAHRMRAQSWGQSASLIALTGWGQETDRQRSLQAGFQQHLVKPIDPQALAELLSNFSRG